MYLHQVSRYTGHNSDPGGPDTSVHETLMTGNIPIDLDRKQTDDCKQEDAATERIVLSALLSPLAPLPTQ